MWYVTGNNQDVHFYTAQAAKDYAKTVLGKAIIWRERPDGDTIVQVKCMEFEDGAQLHPVTGEPLS